jgi:hypothetical protein
MRTVFRRIWRSHGAGAGDNAELAVTGDVDDEYVNVRNCGTVAPR